MEACWSMLISRSGASTASLIPGVARAASSAPDFTRCHHSLSSALATTAIRIVVSGLDLPQERDAMSAKTTGKPNGLRFMILTPGANYMRRDSDFVDGF
jgi:hypothetical protein